MKKILYLSLAIILSFTFASCGKSEEVKGVENAISAIGDVKLTSGQNLSEIEELYNSLPEEEKSEVENYKVFEDKRVDFDNMLRDLSDETKYCARAIISVINTMDLTEFELEEVGIVNVNDTDYAIVVLSDSDGKNETIYIATDAGVVVLGKTLGVFDNNTEFTVFENPVDIDDDFLENYNENKYVDSNEVYAVTIRYMESLDPELIDISGLNKVSALENSTKKSAEDAYILGRLELQNVDNNLSRILKSLTKYRSEKSVLDSEELDRIYDDVLFLCDVTRTRDVSAVSTELEESKQKVVRTLTLVAYESMLSNESFKNLDSATMMEHEKNVTKLFDELQQNITEYVEIEINALK